MELKTIKANIKWIANTGEKYDTKLHDTGVGILKHASEHGDFSEMNNLFNAMGKSSRKEAFKKWVCDHSPLKFDDKVGVFTKSKRNKTDYQYEAADAVPFWNYTVERVQTLDVDKMTIKAFATACLKRIETAKEKGGIIKGDLAGKEAELVAMLHA